MIRTRENIVSDIDAAKFEQIYAWREYEKAEQYTLTTGLDRERRADLYMKFQEIRDKNAPTVQRFENELKEYDRDPLAFHKKSAKTEEDFRSLAKEFRKIHCFAEAKECETTALKMQYNRLVAIKNKAFAEEVYKYLANEFRSMNNYENAKELANECDNAAVKARYNCLVALMTKASTEEEYKNLANEFRSMSGYENTTELANECDNATIKVLPKFLN